MITPATRSQPGPVGPETRLVLDGVSWGTYRRLREEIGDDRSVRLSFRGRRLEIMSPSAGHEWRVDVLVDVAKTAARAERLRWVNVGALTLEHPETAAGGEPDACFYFREAERIAGRDALDTSRDPAPELVIEVDVTSPSTSKDELYATLGVSEVWRYRQGRVSILILDGGAYRVSGRSRLFAWLAAVRIDEVVADATHHTPSEAVDTFADWVRSTVRRA